MIALRVVLVMSRSLVVAVIFVSVSEGIACNEDEVRVDFVVTVVVVAVFVEETG